MNDITPLNDISSKVFDELFTRFQDLDTNVLLVYLIDSVNESALVHLAEQFHIMGNEGWLQTRNEVEKRDLIKRAIEIHRYKGTKYALYKIFDMFAVEGNIQEWFEFGGEPFTFKIDLDFMSKSLDMELIDKLEDLNNEYKNVRSHLSSLKISLSSVSDFTKYKSASISGETVTVNPYLTSFVWDENAWDENYWTKEYETKINLPKLIWDECDFDETLWCFG